MVHEDDLPLSATARPGLSPGFLQVIDWMLSPRPADRPQSVAMLREVLAGRRPIPTRRDEPLAPAWQRTAVLPPGPAPMAEPEIDLDLTIVQPVPAPQIPAVAPRPAAPAPRSSATPPPVRATAPRQGASPMVSTPLPPSSGPSAAAWVACGVLVLVVAASALWAWNRSPPEVGRAQAEPTTPATAKLAPGTAVPDKSAPAPAVAAALPGPSMTAALPTPAMAPAASATTRAAVTTPATAAPKAVRTPAVAAAPRESHASTRPPEPALPQPQPTTPPSPYSAQAQPTDPAPMSQRQQPTRQAEAGSRMPRGNATQVVPAPVPSEPPQAAPVAAPAVVAAGNPREGCGGRVFLALHACMVRQCALPQYTNHRDCERVRLIEERARNSPG
jgi:hypothetical protein